MNNDKDPVSRHFVHYLDIILLGSILGVIAEVVIRHPEFPVSENYYPLAGSIIGGVIGLIVAIIVFIIDSK